MAVVWSDIVYATVKVLIIIPVIELVTPFLSGFDITEASGNRHCMTMFERGKG